MTPEAALAWFNVFIPRKRGLRRALWRFLIPSACRESVEDAARIAAERLLKKRKDNKEPET